MMAMMLHEYVKQTFSIQLTVSPSRKSFKILSKTGKSHDITENMGNNRWDERACAQEQESTMISKQCCIG